jgi:hypothetical protein
MCQRESQRSPGRSVHNGIKERPSQGSQPVRHQVDPTLFRRFTDFRFQGEKNGPSFFVSIYVSIAIQIFFG